MEEVEGRGAKTGMGIAVLPVPRRDGFGLESEVGSGVIGREARL